jgi:hypothetical protein
MQTTERGPGTSLGGDQIRTRRGPIERGRGGPLTVRERIDRRCVSQRVGRGATSLLITVGYRVYGTPSQHHHLAEQFAQ